MRKLLITPVLVGLAALTGACIPEGGQPPGAADLELETQAQSMSCLTNDLGGGTCSGTLELTLTNVGEDDTDGVPELASPFGTIVDNGCIHELSPTSSCTAFLEVPEQTHLVAGIYGWVTASAGIASDTAHFAVTPPNVLP